MSCRWRVCLEIDGIATDENGDSCPVGFCMDLGDFKDPIDYDDLISKVSIPGIMKAIHLDHLPISSVRVITPEEYDELYGDEE